MTTDNQNHQTETFVKRTPPYTIYKPNRNGTGGAISFNYNQDKRAIFVEAANQMGEKRFDWDKKIIMKWGLSDLGSILAGLQKHKPETKLFHQTEKANSACSLKHYEPTNEPNNDPPSFRLTVSKQDQQDKSVVKVGISLTSGETAILETGLQRAIEKILQW